MKALRYLSAIAILMLIACDDDSTNEVDNTEPSVSEDTFDFGQNDTIKEFTLNGIDLSNYQVSLSENEYNIKVEKKTNDESTLNLILDRERLPFGKSLINLTLNLDEIENYSKKSDNYTLQRNFQIPIIANVQRAGNYVDYLEELSLDGVFLPDTLIEDKSFLATFEVSSNQPLMTSIAAFKSGTDFFIDGGTDVDLVGAPEGLFDNTVKLIKKDFEYIGEEISFDANYYQPQAVVIQPNRLVFDGVQTHSFQVFGSEEFEESFTGEILSSTLPTWNNQQTNIDTNSDLIINLDNNEAENLYFWAVISSNDVKGAFRLSNIETSVDNGLTISKEKLSFIKDFGDSATVWVISTRLKNETNYVLMSQSQKSFEVTLN